MANRESTGGLRIGTRLRWPWSRPRNLEKIALAAQRVSGLGLLAYLFLHIFVTGTIGDGKAAWEGLQAAIDSPLEKVGTLLVIVGAVFHAVNGIRVMLLELSPLVGRPARPDYPYRVQSLGKGQKSILYAAMFLASLATIAGVVILWGL